ncbi:MAG: serine/threonine protein kinase [Bacteroidales bacterium]|nr:serine/threonine protein kinase [Bacteroidales bacterium]
MEEQIISNYKITSKLGLGEMSVIYSGYNIDTPDKKVVLKIFSAELLKDEDLKAHFLQKVKIIKELNHPNVVPILDYILDSQTIGVVSELVLGQNLKFAVSMKDFTKDQNIDFFKQILSGVAYGHSMGLLHRSLDPSNIFFADNYKRVEILDFGLARIFEYDNPKKMKVASPMFLSPEQVKQESEIDQRADIYTLGVLMYFMLSHKTPFSSTSSYTDICEQIVNNSIPALPRYPEINEIITKATAKNPDNRYQTCEEFIEAIEKL